MTSKENQPATPLPWQPVRTNAGQFIRGDTPGNASGYFIEVRQCRGNRDEQQDARYIAHAANAYPRLVEALRGIIQSYDANNGDSLANAVNAACDTLAELGEAE